MVGARGWKADYALVVTWERMSYGGAPKITDLSQYERAKRWVSLELKEDEVRTAKHVSNGDRDGRDSLLRHAQLCTHQLDFLFCEWSPDWRSRRQAERSRLSSFLFSSPSQVGFNGGNGTGYFDLPYSAEGNSYKLVQFGSTQIAGRWVARVDEVIQYGGCNNDSRGISPFYRNPLQEHSRLLNNMGTCLVASPSTSAVLVIVRRTSFVCSSTRSLSIVRG